MSGYVKAGYSFLKNIIKPSKVSKDITSVPPTVAKTEKEKLLSQLNIKKQQVKGAGARLKQTQFEKANPEFKGEDFTFATRVGRSSKVRDNKMAGGFMGKRMGYKKGTGLIPKRKSNVEKIKETFGPKQKPQSRMTGKKKKFPDLTGDGKVTFADILKGRGVINGKKKKKII